MDTARDEPNYLLVRGQLLETLGRYAEALETFRRMKEDRDFPMLDFEIFAMLICLDRFEEAMAMLAEMKQTEEQARLLTAVMTDLRGDHAGAITILEDTIPYQPPELHNLHRGICARCLGDSAKAIERFTWEQTVYPRNATLLELFLTREQASDREALAHGTYLYWSGRKVFLREADFTTAVRGYQAIERGELEELPSAAPSWRRLYYLEQLRFSLYL